MEINNRLYKNQGIHVISTIFTVDNGEVKVILLKQKKQPFKNNWLLVGGALYNNESLINGMKREIYEKTGINDIMLYYSDTFDMVYRSNDFRMIAISYIGFISKEMLNKNKDNLKIDDSNLISINKMPTLEYDHNQIFNKALENLKKYILKTDILKNLFSDGFTLPELQEVVELILDKKFDRRNFRKKVLPIIEDTGKKINYKGTKPGKIYVFKEEAY